MIVRVIKNKNYTTISNLIFQNKNLSLKAKGLLALCLSLPDDWDFNKNGLMSFSTDGRNSIETAITELKNEHYLIINKIKTENGKFDSEWVIYEKPYTEKPMTEKPMTEKPMTEKPMTEKPMTEKPMTENQHLQNNKNKIIKTNNLKQNNNIQNNNNIIIPTYEEIENYCKEKGYEIDIEDFIHYWTEKEWKRWDKNLKKYVPIKDIKGTIRTWAKNEKRYEEDRQVNIGSKKAYIKDVEYKTKPKETAQQRDDRNLKKLVEVGEKMLKEWNDDNTRNSEISETNQNALTDNSDTRT